MRPHVADGYGLARGSGRGIRGASLYLARRNATDESTADLIGVDEART
jgi:hypothetical protein